MLVRSGRAQVVSITELGGIRADTELCVKRENIPPKQQWAYAEVILVPLD